MINSSKKKTAVPSQIYIYCIVFSYSEKFYIQKAMQPVYFKHDPDSTRQHEKWLWRNPPVNLLYCFIFKNRREFHAEQIDKFLSENSIFFFQREGKEKQDVA